MSGPPASAQPPYVQAGTMQPYPVSARPQRSSSRIFLALALIFVGMNVLFWGYILVFAYESGEFSEPAPVPYPTQTVTQAPPSPTQVTNPPTPTPTPTATPTSPYVNDDYTPPPVDPSPPQIPGPATEEEARLMLTANLVYSETVPAPIRCEVGDIDVAGSSADALEAQLNELVGCYMRVWEQPIADAGYVLPRPSVTVYTEPITTKCGQVETHNAFYCAADQRLYFAKDIVEWLPEELQNSRVVPFDVMAHEFGHYLQGRTGIYWAEYALQSQEPTESAELALYRRLELQADCFSGEAVRAISLSTGMTQADYDAIALFALSTGDELTSSDPNFEGDHGKGKNRQFWVQTGLGSADVGACNTFVASAEVTR